MVYGILKTTYEGSYITTEDLNLGLSSRDSDEVTRNSVARLRVGSSANPSTDPRFVFGNEEAKIRIDTAIKSSGGSMVYKV